MESRKESVAEEVLLDGVGRGPRGRPRKSWRDPF